MAAALQFGLASELWAKNLGENPFRPDQAEPVSGNGQAVPVTKPEASSNGSAPTVDSLKKLMDKLPADDAKSLKAAFMADHHPSFDGDMNFKHLSKAEHRIALKQLIDEYQTVANPCLNFPQTSSPFLPTSIRASRAAKRTTGPALVAHR